MNNLDNKSEVNSEKINLTMARINEALGIIEANDGVTEFILEEKFQNGEFDVLLDQLSNHERLVDRINARLARFIVTVQDMDPFLTDFVLTTKINLKRYAVGSLPKDKQIKAFLIR